MFWFDLGYAVFVVISSEAERTQSFGEVQSTNEIRSLRRNRPLN
jgi:hypothetical protein